MNFAAQWILNILYGFINNYYNSLFTQTFWDDVNNI